MDKYIDGISHLSLCSQPQTQANLNKDDKFYGDEAFENYQPADIKEVDFSEINFLKAIGKGSFGVVYKAEWNGKSVAVKLVETENEVLAFGNEIRHLSRVRHENIIEMYATGTSPNAKCIIMEFASDGSLFEFLHFPPYPKYDLTIALSWLLQCSKAIAYLHGMRPKPLIHRDLKPLNMLLTENKKVLKVCDFGTACDLRSVMTDNRGSTAWMAPEVIKGSNYNEKCDVYSWGMTLWEVLTRRIPFEDLGQMFRILWQVVHKVRPPLIQGCPKPLEWLLKRCWMDDQQERPTMREVIDVVSPLYKLMSGTEDLISYDFSSCDFPEDKCNSVSSGEYIGESDFDQGEPHQNLRCEDPRICLSDVSHTVLKSHDTCDVNHFSASPILVPFENRPRPMVAPDRPILCSPLSICIPNEGFAERDDLVVVSEQDPGFSPVLSAKNESQNSNFRQGLPTDSQLVPESNVIKFSKSTLFREFKDEICDQNFPPESKCAHESEDNVYSKPIPLDLSCCEDGASFPLPNQHSNYSMEHSAQELSAAGDLWQLLDAELKPKLPIASSPHSQKIFEEHKLLARKLLVAQENLVYLNQKKSSILKVLDEQTSEQITLSQAFKEEINSLRSENAKLRSTRQHLIYQLEELKRDNFPDSGYSGFASNSPGTLSRSNQPSFLQPRETLTRFAPPRTPPQRDSDGIGSESSSVLSEPAARTNKEFDSDSNR